MRNTSPIIVNEIRRLSQDEGLRDSEIAEIIKYNRVSIQRIRQDYGIPTYNIENRKDKDCVCAQCGNHYMIRRREKPGICCPACEQVLNAKILNQNS